MASNITAGIRETTTVFEGVEIGRERLPRFIGRDGILVVKGNKGYILLFVDKNCVAIFSARSTWTNVAQGNGK